MKKTNYLPDVKKHYEDYPYPERNPNDEKIRLANPMTDCLDRINHYCHSGKKDFHKGSRILIAGGGTGDATLFYAEQLRETDSEIVYIDFSIASIDIAKQRAKIRGLNNITWIHDSLLNIPKLELGHFDHINSTGVLHHLADPVEGLRAIQSVLKPDGAMSLMVYAHYGRTVIYQIQELMRQINKDENNRQKQIDNCRKVLETFPKDHWYYASNLNKNKIPDIELYDLFLHSQDRPYTIPELYDWLNSANLEMIRLFDPDEKAGNALYNPSTYISDPNLLNLVNNLSLERQQAIAEILNGRIMKHNFYAANKLPDQNDLYILDNTPSLSLVMTQRSYASIHQLVCNSEDKIVIDIPNTGASIRFNKTTNMERFFQYFDGQKSLKKIYDQIMMKSRKKNRTNIKPVNYLSLKDEFNDMFNAMTSHSVMLFRHKSLPLYKNMQELQDQMKNIKSEA